MEWMQNLLEKLDEEEFAQAMGVAKLIWLRRNSFIFYGPFLSPSFLNKQASASMEGFLQANAPLETEVLVGPCEKSSWIRPPVDFLKCNWDASIDGRSKKMGLGLVVRDSSGGFRAVAISIIPYITDLEIAKSIAARWVVSMCAELGFQSVVFEGDALVVVNSLLSPSPCWRICGGIVEDTRSV